MSSQANRALTRHQIRLLLASAEQEDEKPTIPHRRLRNLCMIHLLLCVDEPIFNISRLRWCDVVLTPPSPTVTLLPEEKTHAISEDARQYLVEYKKVLGPTSDSPVWPVYSRQKQAGVLPSDIASHTIQLKSLAKRANMRTNITPLSLRLNSKRWVIEQRRLEKRKHQD